MPFSILNLNAEGRRTYFYLKQASVFDSLYYLANNSDVLNSGHDALSHYIAFGAREDRNPCQVFASNYYRRVHNIYDFDINPLFHFLNKGNSRRLLRNISLDEDDLGSNRSVTYSLIRASGFFDAEYYLSHADDVAAAKMDPIAHYIEHGAVEGRDPSQDFSTRFYQATYADVAGSGLNPLLHFALYGDAEGRIAKAPSSATADQSEVNLPFGANIGTQAASSVHAGDEEISEIRQSALFDAHWYREMYPEVGTADPATHFFEIGGVAGLDPSPFFDSSAYLEANGDVAGAGVNPLLHWLRNGKFEGRPVPVRQNTSSRPLLLLSELCDPHSDELWKSEDVDLRFSILTPTYNTAPYLLRELYQTLRNQTYAGWEWVVCDDGSTRADTVDALLDIAALDPRVIIVPRPAGGKGISSATNAALSRASGDFAVLVDHDDLLSRSVFQDMRVALKAKNCAVDMLYTDECKVSEAGLVYDIFLKPAWSPSLLESTMYIGHLTAYRTQFMRELGGLRSDFDGTQDYDLALRASSATNRVIHVQTIGYLWRAIPGSTAASLDEKSYAIARQEKALLEYARRRNPEAAISQGYSLGWWRVHYPVTDTAPKLTYVIPTAAGRRMVRGKSVDLVTHCIESLERTSFYPNTEIVVVHNGNLTREHLAFFSKRPTLKLIEYKSQPFNLAQKINIGVMAAAGKYVCLLNDDVESITERGGEALVGFLESQPSVGAIAPFCMFEDERSQHNGVVLLEQGPSHAGIFKPANFGGDSGFLRCRREMFAVSGAMLICRLDLYKELGGFNEAFPLNYNDVDFCLRVRARGYSCVVDPDVKVYHFESASKSGTFKCEKERLFAEWPGLSDPYFNLGFDQRDPSFKVTLANRKFDVLHDAISFERWLDLRIGDGRGAVTGDTSFSVCVPIYNQPPSLLNEMFASVQMQTWPNKELVLVDDASTRSDTRDWLDQHKNAPGLKVLRLKENKGIVGAQKHFLELATGEFIIPLDADDFLTVDALAVLAEAISRNPGHDIFYSDEFKSNVASEKFAPFHKTSFDPVLISNCCYTCHAMALRTSSMKELDAYGDRRATWCHDWDTTFRAIASGREPIHVPEQLYGWRINPGSTASVESAAKPEAVDSQRFVLERAIDSRGLSDRLGVVENPQWPKSGMWSLVARSPIRDVSILRADTLWNDNPAAILAGVSNEKREWVAILVDFDGPLARDALLKLSAVALWDDRVGVVSGCLSQQDGKRVLWAGGVFTSTGYMDPFQGSDWDGGGYYGRLFGQRCVDVASPINVLIRTERLREALNWLDSGNHQVTPANLMFALGRLAAGGGWLVAVTPLLRVDLAASDRQFVPVDQQACALARADTERPSRWYGTHLDPERAFKERPIGQICKTRGQPDLRCPRSPNVGDQPPAANDSEPRGGRMFDRLAGWWLRTKDPGTK